MTASSSGHVLTRRGRLARTITATTLAFAFGIAAVAFLGQGHGGSPPVAAGDIGAATKVEPPQGATARPVPLDSAVFSTGSCVAFAPTSGNRHQTVFLDAGHGGPDPGGQGAVAGHVVTERDLTLAVALAATKILQADGFRVVDSRTTSSAVIKLRAADLSGSLFSLEGKHRDTAARPLCANLAGASALVSIHFNVGGSASNAGAETTYDAARPFAAQNKALAAMLQSTLENAMRAVPGWDIPDDGVVADDTVGNSLTSQGASYGHLLVLGPAAAGYFNTPSTMPGALVEPLYLTDPFEGAIANSAKGQAVIAQAIANAVQQFLAR